MLPIFISKILLLISRQYFKFLKEVRIRIPKLQRFLIQRKNQLINKKELKVVKK